MRFEYLTRAHSCLDQFPGNAHPPDVARAGVGRLNISKKYFTGASFLGRVTMMTAKEKMVQIIQEQPEDSSFEELLRELAFALMVERGILRDNGLH